MSSLRHIDGLAYAMRTGRITRGDYIEITGVSKTTASRDLAALTGMGALRAEGQTRNRIYIYERRMGDEPIPTEKGRLPPEGQ